MELNVCIVGAGPGGLSAARMLRAAGIAYDHYERHTQVGGIWDIANPGTPMYRSAHFISSRDMSGYRGFPMPANFAEYPTREQVLSYVSDFAEAYDLRDAIRFGTSVDRAERVDGGWSVTTSGSGAEREPQHYTHVICASGHTWDPITPTYPGHFDGHAMHAVDYNSPDLFHGKRVLIVGAGNSACDIACDAARSADRAFISMRRGYHFIPKYLFGQPADAFAAGGPSLPLRLKQAVFGGIVRLHTGDVTRYGLPRPDHRILESHPIVNDQLLHHLRHGDIAVRPEIERMDGSAVVFKDGRREEVDLVVFATGYRYSIPYVDETVFGWSGVKPDLDYATFNPRDDTIFCVGFVETNAGSWADMDDMSALIAGAIRTQTERPAEWPTARDAIRRAPDLSGGISFVASSRHDNYVDSETATKAIQKLNRHLGWPDAEALLSRLPEPSSPGRSASANRRAAA